MYQDLAMRTCSPTNKDTIQAVLGLISECGEFATQIKNHRAQGHDLDTSNLIEEIGDELWYFAMYCETSGRSLSNYITDPKVHFDQELALEGLILGWALTIGGLAKEELVGYKDALADVRTMECIMGLVTILGHICYMLGTDLESVMEKNINKLRVRYPEKFEPEQSLNRDTEAEQEVLKS
jgi:NTP pyrophosphatase (non-canonical NTP hydrolase)